MLQVNIHEAKTQLSKLIDAAVRGEPFVIAKAGKPLVIVKRLDQGSQKSQRLGFLKDHFKIPEDFDHMGHDELERMFQGEQ